MSVTQYHEIEITSGVDTIKFSPASYEVQYSSMVAPNSGRTKDATMKIVGWYARKLVKLSITLPGHRYDDSLYSRIISYVQGQEVKVSFYDYMSHEYVTNMDMYCSETKAGYSYKGLIEGVTFELVCMSGTNTIPHIKANYAITTSVSPSGSGTVAGGGNYTKNATVVLTATPASGYDFSQWSDGNTSNPRTITVTQDKSYQAVFTAIPVQYTISTAVTPTGTGTVSGGGTYNSGTSVTLTATPGSGYMFSQWSDGSTTNPRTITVSGDATYTAEFIAGTPPSWTIVFSDYISNSHENDPEEEDPIPDYDVRGESLVFNFTSNNQSFSGIHADSAPEDFLYYDLSGGGSIETFDYQDGWYNSNYKTIIVNNDPAYIFTGDWESWLQDNAVSITQN